MSKTSMVEEYRCLDIKLHLYYAALNRNSLARKLGRHLLK
jgi:hypothetical protein